MASVGETCDCYKAKNDLTEQSNNFNEIESDNSQGYFTEMENSSDFWIKVELCADKFMKGQLWDVPLLGERTFFLNKNHSKWICAGLSTDFNFEPIIKIAGIKKQCVAAEVGDLCQSKNCKLSHRATKWLHNIFLFFYAFGTVEVKSSTGLPETGL
ncbi:hypothetical protein QE152_g13338 [Popillia japonica]|uniref:Uncharacterized protein n=1 Tax=Popillia japonica TaxID=7064 RepID=A0AAW1LDE2_POPJA